MLTYQELYHVSQRVFRLVRTKVSVGTTLRTNQLIHTHRKCSATESGEVCGVSRTIGFFVELLQLTISLSQLLGDIKTAQK